MSEESNHPTPPDEASHAEQAGADAVVNDDPRWLDKPGSVNLLIYILIAACSASVLADFFYHKHGEFHFQEFVGFDAIYGFVAYVGLVNLAKGVRILLMRNEDYYD
jgi:hypothetical protein